MNRREASGGSPVSDVRRAPNLVPGWLARLIAWRRQIRGRYDEDTAAWFRHAWERNGGLASLTEWLAFGRELGRLPDAEQVQMLLTALGDRRGSVGRIATELLIEAGAWPADGSLDTLAWLGRHADRSPPIARVLLGAGEAPTPRLSGLAEFDASQARWREEFAQYLSDAPGRICVVGNAATLHGAGLGRKIDDHRPVVRFNRWHCPTSAPGDIGTRADVWVCTPRFLPEAIAMGPRPVPWMILTGPDARYRRAGRAVDWDIVLRMLDAGVKVVTIPLAVWSESVARLAAPPSAGVLFLGWGAHLVGGFGRLAIAGFDSAGAGAAAYHHAGARLRPGRRHAWAAERQLLREWQGQGLQRLDRRG